ncbi:MAG TPA: arginine--tRNA ligase [Elusimicrobia bacterium]|nr:MAG: arginine--tRNA ligase [Elusimicrobia bacterium GWA2_64_40]OGR62702.1 MAG: arginine--tRNA ligase [Elusimicrobia bacterium GWB2_63_16]HAN05553.1 arginine--tRNA ligase [Elusimicrobiota bacterium]HAU90282.1 arginine--tRNA ligase [Elusimicrobiota bacterium]
MKISVLEADLKSRAKAAFALDDAAVASFTLAAPPPHIKADASIAWPIAGSKLLRKAPLVIAGELKAALGGSVEAEVVPPGFVNVKFAPAFLFAALRDLEKPGSLRRPEYAGEKINLEFVSANPTGPMHLASGRGATLGDSLARIWKELGAEVATEFYVNNVGRQVEKLGLSLKARFEGKEPPEDGYQGDYLKGVAAALPPEAEEWTDKQFSDHAVTEMLQLHRADMLAFGVEFDRWFLESELHQAGGPAKALATLKERGMVYEKDGAVWFGAASELESDDKDRVLVKADGRNTYFLNDIAYHLNKFSRGFKRLIDIWGADHHGYVPRMEAAVKALGSDLGSFKVIIHQQVSLLRGKEVVKMSKRAGDFISLKELMEDVGTDACRFFFASRGPNTHLNFDVELAKKKSNENPVYYVQYVHARICSIFDNAAAKGVDPAAGFDEAKAVINPEERALMLKLLWLEKTLSDCARDNSPHHLTTYLSELAASFHSFYDQHKVLDPENKEVTAFRLFLLKSVKGVIAKGLGLLGVSAPERM